MSTAKAFPLGTLNELCKKHGIDPKRSKDDCVIALRAAGVKAKELKEAAQKLLDEAINGEKVEDPQPEKRDLKAKKEGDEGFFCKTKAKIVSGYEKTKETIVDGYETTKAHLNTATVVAHVEGIGTYSSTVVKMGLVLGSAYIGMSYFGIGIVTGLFIFTGVSLIAKIIADLFSRRKVGDKYAVGFFATILNSIKEAFSSALNTVNCFRKVEVAVKAN